MMHTGQDFTLWEMIVFVKTSLSRHVFLQLLGVIFVFHQRQGQSHFPKVQAESSGVPQTERIRQLTSCGFMFPVSSSCRLSNRE